MRISSHRHIKEHNLFFTVSYHSFNAKLPLLLYYDTIYYKRFIDNFKMISINSSISLYMKLCEAAAEKVISFSIIMNDIKCLSG